MSLVMLVTGECLILYKKVLGSSLFIQFSLIYTGSQQAIILQRKGVFF